MLLWLAIVTPQNRSNTLAIISWNSRTHLKSREKWAISIETNSIAFSFDPSIEIVARFSVQHTYFQKYSRTNKHTNTRTHTHADANAEEKHRPRVRERGTATLLLSSSTEIIACLLCRIAFAISHTTIQLSHKITIYGKKFQHTLTAFLTINI